MPREARSEQMWFRMTSQERASVERMAKLEGLSPAEYVRCAVLVTLAVSGDRFAISQLGLGMYRSLVANLADLVPGSRDKKPRAVKA